jgi:cytochrome c biogenesis factor
MIQKLLAWIAFALAMLFVVLSVAALATWEGDDGGTGRMLFWGAIATLVISMLLAVATLVVSAFQSDT